MRNRKKLRQAEFAHRGFSDRTVMLIGFLPQCGKLEFARRAGGQVVRKICVVVSALRRSVSFYGSINWNLIDN